MAHYKITRTHSFVALLLFITTTQVFAAPKPINYQGYLTNPDGTPIDGTITTELELWTDSTAGDLLYSESHAMVAVSKGLFSIEIGTGTPISGTFNADLFSQDTWLALTINSELLSPRTRLGAVADSHHAEIAERLSISCADGDRLGFRDGMLNCYECERFDSIQCYEGPPETAGIGACRTGNHWCTDGAYRSECTGQVLPDAEVCDSIDNDCNGLVDDGASLPGCVDLYIDADGDTYGDPASLSCRCPTTQHTVMVGGDCDDTDSDVRPDQTLFFFSPTNSGGFDYNCDGAMEQEKSFASCTYNGSGCDYVPGFVDSIPDCGQWGLHSSGCAQNNDICTVINAGSQRMYCR